MEKAQAHEIRPHISARKLMAKHMAIGTTKSDILLYIADQQEADTIDIKRYLKNKSDIRNKKSIRIHLTDLTGSYLQKKNATKGKPDTYYLPANFHTLQATFNFLKQNKKEMDFMKTKYFKTYVSSNDFLLKFFTNLLKGYFLGVVEYIKSDEGYKEVSSSVRENKKIILAIRNSDIKKAKYTKLRDINKIISLRSEKKISLAQTINSVIAILEQSDTDSLFDFLSQLDIVSDVLQKLPHLLIPEKEIPDIISILKASPSASDFVLNLQQHETLGIMSPLIRFFLWSIKDDPQKTKAIRSILNDKDNISTNLPIYDLMKDFSNVENKSPILTILSSLFIFDYIKRNIVINEEDSVRLDAVLNDIFLPKLTTSDSK